VLKLFSQAGLFIFMWPIEKFRFLVC